MNKCAPFEVNRVSFSDFFRVRVRLIFFQILIFAFSFIPNPLICVIYHLFVSHLSPLFSFHFSLSLPFIMHEHVSACVFVSDCAEVCQLAHTSIEQRLLSLAHYLSIQHISDLRLYKY